MSINTLSPDAGDPMCRVCRCLVGFFDCVETNDGLMHERCRSEGYRDIACRLLDKLERDGWRPDEVAAMTARVEGLNPPHHQDCA